jgi:hypothetical protein
MIRRATVEERSDGFLAEERAVAGADRPAGEVDQHGEVGGQRLADQRVHLAILAPDLDGGKRARRHQKWRPC